MGDIVTTELGRFCRVNLKEGRPADTWIFECPGCGTWAYMDEDQWNGQSSVDHATDGCVGGYHETHDYWGALSARLHPGEPHQPL